MKPIDGFYRFAGTAGWGRSCSGCHAEWTNEVPLKAGKPISLWCCGQQRTFVFTAGEIASLPVVDLRRRLPLGVVPVGVVPEASGETDYEQGTPWT